MNELVYPRERTLGAFDVRKARRVERGSLGDLFARARSPSAAMPRNINA